MNREPIHPGMKVLESRKGHTSHNINPWFAIDAGDAGEEHGGVWFGALAWSGNWRITVEQTPYQQVRVTGGLNTFDFAYPLEARRIARHAGLLCRLFEQRIRRSVAPAASLRARADSRPAASRRASGRCCTTHGKPPTFNVNEAGQTQLADTAAKLGVELFVMDDGWFGKRNNDHAGLGDWTVNPQKFPPG